MSIGLSSELLYSQMQKSKNDSKAVGLQNKLTGINSDSATDEEMMEVCKEFESYLVDTHMVIRLCFMPQKTCDTIKSIPNNSCS